MKDSPLSEKHKYHTLNGLRVHLTPIQVAGYLSGNNSTI